MHPFLFSTWIVLHVVAGNLDEVSLRDAWRALPVLWVGVAAIVALLRPVCRSWRGAMLVTTFALVLFFSFAALLGRPGAPFGAATPGRVAVLGSIEAALCLGLIVLVRRTRRHLFIPQRILNLTTAFLVCFGVLQFGWFAWRSDPALRAGQDTEIPTSSTQSLRLDNGGRPLRDIYFILLDGYARSDVLQRFFEHDNTDFVQALESMQFQVRRDAYSNYLSTKLVLPSLLNMRYLDHLARQYGAKYPNVRPLEREIQHNRVVASLRQAGYRIVNIQSDVPYTDLANVDEAISWSGPWWAPNRLETALIGMTPLHQAPWSRAWTSPASAESRRAQHVRFNLRALGDQASRKGPKFVFAHIMSPHQPFVFDRDGELRTDTVDWVMFHDLETAQEDAVRRAYADQVTALNREVLASLQRIQQDSEVAPIIILLGDHGLRLYLRDRPEDSCLQESFGILYAMSLPGTTVRAANLPRTPVNTFRMLFDVTFGTRLGALPDHAWFAHRGTGYYNYRDVTSEVETCAPDPEDGLTSREGAQ